MIALEREHSARSARVTVCWLIRVVILIHIIVMVLIIILTFVVAL